VAVNWGRVGRWSLALGLTLASAFYQRMTGPTHPLRGHLTVGGAPVTMRLLRSHGGEGGLPIQVEARDPAVTGEVAWRRWPMAEPWQVLPLARDADGLEAFLPHQPPAGKVEYQLRLSRGEARATFPEKPAVARFKGYVTPWILIPHILFMFAAMLASNAAGIEALFGNQDPRRHVKITAFLLGVGGFVLGPSVQKMAFGAWWTGVPFGWDLTDNKTLIAGVAWAVALWSLRGGRKARWAILGASAVTLAVFAIPHSVWGSQIDWSKAAGG